MNRIGRRCAFGVIVLGLALGTQSYAWAGDADDDGCKYESNAHLRIAYCNSVILSGRYSGSNLAWAFASRGFVYLGKGNLDQAILDDNAALRLNPNDAVTSFNRGLAYYSKSKYDRAIDDFSEAIRLRPGYAKAFENRALAYSQKGQYDRAINDYDEAIRLNSDFEDAFKGRAWV